MIFAKPFGSSVCEALWKLTELLSLLDVQMCLNPQLAWQCHLLSLTTCSCMTQQVITGRYKTLLHRNVDNFRLDEEASLPAVSLMLTGSKCTRVCSLRLLEAPAQGQNT